MSHHSQHAIRRGGAVLGLLLGSVLLLLSLASTAAQSNRVIVVDVDGTITPVMAGYIERGIQDAEKSGANALVLRMDTPGGLSSSTDEIIKDILASEVPVVVYIAPQGARAGSAGVYITYAAHVAAMAPSTNIGSATPIFVGQSGETQNTDEDLKRKVINDSVARIRGLAELRGRNADWAEQAVREAANVSATEAVDQRIVDLIAPSLPALLDQIDGRQVQAARGPVTLRTRAATIDDLGMSITEQLFQIISDPTIAYLLLSLGMLGLFLEFANPGTILPGVAGGIAILLGLFSLGSLEVSWAGILLMAFGFLLFLLDIYLPSAGVLTIGGIISFLLGSIMLANSAATPELEISRAAIFLVTAVLAATFILVGGAIMRTRLRKATTGREGLTGEIGTARQTLDPEGFVFVEGERWHAVSLAGRIEAGTPVRIVAVKGLSVNVVPADSEEFPAGPAESSPTRGRLGRMFRFGAQ